mmetsp:Transcript_24608/g.38221  ORF Transcript_24608/g.38221 Transcript_24608/m.38221 type:complete len:125 (+) Transcript_24608:1903-2277(+)
MLDLESKQARPLTKPMHRPPKTERVFLVGPDLPSLQANFSEYSPAYLLSEYRPRGMTSPSSLSVEEQSYDSYINEFLFGVSSPGMVKSEEHTNIPWAVNQAKVSLSLALETAQGLLSELLNGGT